MSVTRFVIVSGYFPPVIGGTSTVMRNLLSAFDPGTFIVVAESPDAFDGVHDAAVPDGIKIVRTGVPACLTRRIPYGARFKRWLRYALVPRISNLIVRSIREIGAEKIVSVYPSWPFFISAWLAHLRTGVPIVTYYMDISPKAELVSWPDSPVIRHFEPRILRAAKPRLVLSEAIAADITERFSLDSVVIPHSIDLSGQRSGTVWPAQSQRLIVHTGVVDWLQQEGLLRIARVIEDHPEMNARLVLATPTPKAVLLEQGFNLGCVEILKLTNEEVRALQHAASVLVAVLPFHGRIPAFQLTSFPTKVVEYMTTGAPILAHTPRESFFGRHVAEHRYALLADSTEPAALHDALATLLNDRPAAESLAASANTAVREQYALPKVAARFAEACGLAPSTLWKNAAPDV